MTGHGGEEFLKFHDVHELLGSQVSPLRLHHCLAIFVWQREMILAYQTRPTHLDG